VYVEYAYGMLIPTVYVEGGKRLYPAAVPASLFMGPDAKDEREWQMGLISAALGSAAASAKGEVAKDAAMSKECPVLHAFMTQLEEDGKARTPSSLVVFTEDGVWKGCLTDRDANVKLWRTGDNVQKLLQAFEKALASGQADWRRGYDPAKAGKGKKGR
jgi:hypothetical protein